MSLNYLQIEIHILMNALAKGCLRAKLFYRHTVRRQNNCCWAQLLPSLCTTYALTTIAGKVYTTYILTLIGTKWNILHLKYINKIFDLRCFPVRRR